MLMTGWLILRAWRPSQGPHFGMTSKDLRICAAAPMVYAFIHVLALWEGSNDPAGLHGMICMEVALIAFLAFVAAWRWRGKPRSHDAGKVEWIAMAGAAGAGGCALAGAVFFWLGAGAELSGSAVNWTGVVGTERRNALLQRSIELVPFERQYRTRLLFEHLGRAVQGVTTPGLDAGRYGDIKRELDAAEFAGRRAWAMFSDDPWVLMAMTNVLQVKALAVLRGFDPAAGDAAAREADQLFAAAHALFPEQPLLLRNWAQLKFDGGYRADAYELLDRMEAILPDVPDAYLERMVIAQRSGDSAVFRQTLARARSRLAPPAMQQLMDVANLQQLK
jgi:hypothetical protein